jgi:protein-S-isoprenylcysteine O-methyltransferase Ste14
VINLRFDHLGLFGLRQAWSVSPCPRFEQLCVLGPYRYIRNPLMTCLLVVLWGQPILPPTLALLSGGLSAYIAVGLVYEERNLARRFGPAYVAYRSRVPALLPWRLPAPPGMYSAVQPDCLQVCP